MSLNSKIEAVIYASEEPVTLQQLVALLGEEASAELDRLAAEQGMLSLPLLEESGGQSGTAVSADETGTRNVSDTAQPVQNALGTPTRLPDETDADATSTADAAPVAATDAVLAAGTDARSAATVDADPAASADTEAEKRRTRERERAVREHIRRAVDRLIRDYAESDRGIEIREVANGYRMATKPEYHDAVRGFVKSLKPALKLTLPALETLAVVAYKQPVTAAELSEIRGVDSAGVLGGLLARKLIATAGRKQVIGRPMLYRTTRDFLLRFGLKDISELPSMDEFQRMAGELAEGEDVAEQQGSPRGDEVAMLVEQANVRGDAEHIREVTSAEGNDADSFADAGETDDTAESDDALAAEAGADTSTEMDRNATAETAAEGNDDRHTEGGAAAPLHTTQAGEPAPERKPDQASESTSGQAAAGAEEGERVGAA